MKKHLFSLMLIAAFGSYAAAFAQSEIVVGDMNDDGQLTVGDVTALSETVIGHKAVRRISVAGDPYATDNSSIVGRWSGVSGTITFNSDGTTDYKEGYTYEYLPSQSLIVFYDETNAAREFLDVVILKSNKLVLSDVSMTKAYTYGDHAFVSEDGTIYYEDSNGHRYVDLGLPSGTLWATTNVGADTPEDYGYYFAWGEVEPKSIYSYSTYFDSVNGSAYNFKKYNIDGGTTHLELDLEDDAAYMNWGEGWRMPNLAQIQELYNSNYVTTEWVTQKGKNGRLITSKSNGASLFLPAVGYRYYGYLYDADSMGYYWSRSLSTSYSDYAWGMNLDSRNNWWHGRTREHGQSVRPVRATPVSGK